MIFKKTTKYIFFAIMVLVALRLIESCQNNGSIMKVQKGIEIKVECLTKDEMQIFYRLNCSCESDQLIKKIIIKNNLYDEIKFWSTDYCKANKNFLLFDALYHYRADTIVSRDLINPTNGYPVIVNFKDSVSIFFRSRKNTVNQKHKYFFWGEIDSSNVHNNIEFNFIDSIIED